jgi:diguanylate cyclase (GGDEF)-like protein
MPTQALLKDPLTGVYSRAVLNARLEEELDRAHRYQQPFSLLLLDLDHFKNINDAFGHSRGDQVLVEFAGQLAHNVRSADSIFRYGGDEFVVLLPNTPKEQARSTAQRLIESINAFKFSGKPAISLSLSIGLAAYPQDESTPEGLFDIADRRHQLAKRLGRSQVISETPELVTRTFIDSPSRLIEQDMALAAVNQFLDSLPENNRSVLHVAGKTGTGISRLQAEIRKIAHLRGYAVLAIDSRPSVKNRTFGALLEAQDQLPGYFLDPEADNPGQQLASYLVEKGQSGIIVTIDRLDHIDHGTLEFLRTLFNASEITQLGLVYSQTDPSNPRNFPTNIPLQETIRLKPISPSGLRIWLRQSLQWEAPQDFVAWLHQQTGGLPGNIKTALNYLHHQELLHPKESSWSFPQDLLQTSITQILQRKPILPPNNLPPDLVEIVNRVQELAHIKSLVNTERLVTITGSQGSGKTTLALQVASEMLETFPDGVYLVYPTDEAIHAGLLETIASTLRLPGDQSGLAKPLLGYLRPRDVLFIIDDYAASSSSQAVLQDLINQCDRVFILVTSQAPVDIPGEQVYPLGGLEFPEASNGYDLGRFSACTLFVQAAQRVASSFQAATKNANWIAQICRLVDGLPLALELAASWSQTFDCEEIATRIAQSQANLSAQTGPAEEHLVQSVLDAFWELFSESDQNILFQLTVFKGVFRRDLAQQVTGASPFFLDALASKSLLIKTPQGHYRMPAFLKTYLSGKFQHAEQQLENVRARHCQAYSRYGDQLTRSSPRELQPGSYQAIRLEWQNFLSAWDWSISSDSEEQSLALLHTLAAAFRLQGNYQEALHILALAKEKISVSTPEVEPRHPSAAQLLGELAMQSGEFAYLLGWYQSSYQLLQEAVATFKNCGNPSKSAQALLLLSRTDAALNNQQHHDHVQAGLKIYQQLEDLAGLSDSYNRLGILAANETAYETAHGYFHQALAAATSLDDRYRVARCLNNLGQLAYYQGDMATARQHLTASLELARSLDIPYLTASVLDSLGKLSNREANFPHAASYLREALQIARQLQSIPLAMELMISTAQMWGDAGRQPIAVALLHFLIEQRSLAEKDRGRVKKLYQQHTADLSQAQIDLAGSLHRGKSLYTLLEELEENISEPAQLAT